MIAKANISGSTTTIRLAAAGDIPEKNHLKSATNSFSRNAGGRDPGDAGRHMDV